MGSCEIQNNFWRRGGGFRLLFWRRGWCFWGMASVNAQHVHQKEVALSPAEREAAVRQAMRQELVDNAVGKALTDFGSSKLSGDELAVTLIDLRDAEHPVRASYRGEAQIYPASVVKLFYLVAAHRQMEDGKLEDTAELRRAMKDMIVDSYNEATGYIVDLLTGTTSGPELSPEEIEAWHDQAGRGEPVFRIAGLHEHQRKQKALV